MTVTPELFVVGEPVPLAPHDELQLKLHGYSGSEVLDFKRFTLTEGEFNYLRFQEVASGPLPIPVNINSPLPPAAGSDRFWKRPPYVVMLDQTACVVVPYDSTSEGAGVAKPYMVLQSGTSLGEPLVMDDTYIVGGAKLIVGPAKLGSKLYFGTVDGANKGQIWETDLDLGGLAPLAIPAGPITPGVFPDNPNGFLADSGCNGMVITDTHIAMLENNYTSASNQAWVWELGGGDPVLTPVAGLVGGVGGPVTVLPGVWLPSSEVAGFAWAGRWQTVTIGATVQFTSVWFTINSEQWTVLPDELRVVEGVEGETRQLADGAIIPPTGSLSAEIDPLATPGYSSIRIPRAGA